MGDKASLAPATLVPDHELSIGAAWDQAYAVRELQKLEWAPAFSLSSNGVCSDNNSTEALKQHSWHLTKVHAAAAWALSQDAGVGPGQNVLICQIDTGYTSHPELDGGYFGVGLNFMNREASGGPLADARDPLSTGGFMPTPGHGTGTASMIFGPHGVAPAAHLFPMRVTPTVILFSEVHRRNVADAIRTATANNCRVISISLGTPFSEWDMRMAVLDAAKAGVIVVAAAGQCSGAVVVPADYPGAIAVGGSDIEDQKWHFSADGPSVVIAAPADTIWHSKTTADRDGGYTVDHSSGTSFATAQVAAAAALWLARHGYEALRTKYGDEGVPKAFRWLLIHKAFQKGNWELPIKLGSGVLDVEKLIAADLPERAIVLQQFPALTKPASPDAAAQERLVHLLRIKDEKEFGATLAPLMAVSPKDALAAAKAFPQELVFQLELETWTQAQPTLPEVVPLSPFRPGSLRDRISRDGSSRLKKSLKIQ